MTDLDFFKQQVAKVGEPLSKEETLQVAREIQKALDKLEALGHPKRTFKGVPEKVLKSDKVIARGLRAKNYLHEKNLRLLFVKTRQFCTSEALLEEAIQEANFGLSRACELFNPALGFAFSTYAVNWIRSSVWGFIARHQKMKLATEHYATYQKIIKLKEKYSKKQTKPLTMEEISSILQIPLSKVKEFSNLPSIVSFESYTSSEDEVDSSWEDLIEQPTSTYYDSLKHYQNVIDDCIEPQNPELLEKTKDILEKIKIGETLSAVDKRKITKLLKN